MERWYLGSDCKCSLTGVFSLYISVYNFLQFYTNFLYNFIQNTVIYFSH